MKNKVVLAEKEAATGEEPNPRGIPEFWFTIFRNVDMLSELVQVSKFPPYREILVLIVIYEPLNSEFSSCSWWL